MINLSHYAVLIPSYNPDEKLIQIVEELLQNKIFKIVIVDDGSHEQSQQIFKKILQQNRSSIENIDLIRNAVNLGKGASLKHGLNFIYTHYPEIKRIITADSDGQHLTEDIIRMIHYSEKNPSSSLILGVRDFSIHAKKIPLRSHIGNYITKQITKIISGIKLTDTQTGLRSIPREMVKELLPLKSNRYDFEFDMLLQCKMSAIPIEEIPIKTIYIEENRSSHFNPFVDSMKIYFVMLRFVGSSILTAMIDYSLFSLFYTFSGHILIPQVVARTVAGFFNYNLNKTTVFKSQSIGHRPLLLYIFLVLFNGLASLAIIEAFAFWTNVNILLAKFVAETILYLTSFFVQRDFIFTSKMGNQK